MNLKLFTLLALNLALDANYPWHNGRGRTFSLFKLGCIFLLNLIQDSSAFVSWDDTSILLTSLKVCLWNILIVVSSTKILFSDFFLMIIWYALESREYIFFREHDFLRPRTNRTFFLRLYLTNTGWSSLMNLDMILIAIVTIDSISILALPVFRELSIVDFWVTWDLILVWCNKLAITIIEIDDVIKVKSRASPLLRSLF